MLPRLSHLVLAGAFLASTAALGGTAPPPAADPRLLAELRAAQGQLPDATSLTYSGVYEVEGHMAHPHQVQTFSAEVTVSIKNGAVAWDSRMGPEGATREALSSRERGIVTPQGAFLFDRKGPQVQNPVDSAAYAHTMGAIAPAAFFSLVHEAAPDERSPDRAILRTVMGEEVAVQLEPSTRRILQIDWPRQHRRLGDVTDTIKFTGFEVRAGIQVPQSIEATAHEDTSMYRLRLKLLPTQTAVDTEALRLAADLVAPHSLPPEIKIEELGPGLYAFTHPDADCRCLVQEFDSSLMAFEAPLSSAIGEQLVDAIQARFPGKPLKAIAFSHYHPHYIGGLRAFVAAGCDVYTTPGLEPFVKEILARPFTRKPDRLQLQARAPTIHTVWQRQDLRDAAGSVALIDIGAKSNHTDEYLVFYFPKSKLLFEGDLAYIQPGGTLRVLGRGAGLLDAVQPLGLDIGMILQAWPAQDTPPLKWDTFVQAAKPRAAPTASAPSAPPAAPASPPGGAAR